MTAEHEALLDQVVFRWDAVNRSGSTGFGPVAWSCKPALAEQLYREWPTVIQLTGDSRTPPGLVRVSKSNIAVLARRIPDRDRGGRPGTLCHALVGPTEQLDVETCLGLHAWSWPDSDLLLDEVRGRLDRVRLGALVDVSLRGLHTMQRGLHTVEEPLVNAVAEVLRKPQMRYSLRYFGDQREPYRILLGVHGIFGELLDQGSGFSFATHDTDDTEPLRFAFLSEWPTSGTHDPRRTRVDLRATVRDSATDLARRLVAGQLERTTRDDDSVWEVSQAMVEAASRQRRWREPEGNLLRVAEQVVNQLERSTRSTRKSIDRAPTGARTESPSEPRHSRRDTPAPERADTRQPEVEPRCQRSVETVLPPSPAAGPATAGGAAEVPYPRAEMRAWPELAVVTPEWLAPPPGSSRAGQLGRGATDWQPPHWSGTDDGVAELEQALGQRAWPGAAAGADRATAMLAGAEERDLLDALTEESLSYRATTRLLWEIARRARDWPDQQCLELCGYLLRHGFLLYRWSGEEPGRRAAHQPSGELRAANAAALYGWAVSPYVAEPQVRQLLKELLPALWQEGRASRAAVQLILDQTASSTHPVGSAPRDDLAGEVWFAVLYTAHTGRLETTAPSWGEVVPGWSQPLPSSSSPAGPSTAVPVAEAERSASRWQEREPSIPETVQIRQPQTAQPQTAQPQSLSWPGAEGGRGPSSGPTPHRAVHQDTETDPDPARDSATRPESGKGSWWPFGEGRPQQHRSTVFEPSKQDGRLIVLSLAVLLVLLVIGVVLLVARAL